MSKQPQPTQEEVMLHACRVANEQDYGIPRNVAHLRQLLLPVAVRVALFTKYQVRSSGKPFMFKGPGNTPKVELEK